MPNIGYIVTTLAFVLAVYAAVVAVIGARGRMSELVISARNAALASRA